MDRRFKYYLASGLAVFLVILLSHRLINYSQMEKAEGTVVSVGETGLTNVYRRASTSSNHKFPVISYFVDGKEMTYIKETEILFDKFQVGEKVDLLYHQDKPAKVYVNSIFGFWVTVPSMIMFLLMGVTWFGLLYVIFDSMKKPKEEIVIPKAISKKVV